MAVSRGLNRLFEVRELEERLCRAALEKTLGQLHTLVAALKRTKEREGNGRRQVTASAGSSDAADRVAALEEMNAARRHAAAFKLRIAQLEAEAVSRRQELMGKRTERRQAETLIGKIESTEAAAAARRGQQQIDDWFLTRATRAHEKGEKKET